MNNEFTPEDYLGYVGALAFKLGVIKGDRPDGAASYLWETECQTPEAWKGIFPARYFHEKDLNFGGISYEGGGWIAFPINAREWDRVFVDWCERKEIVHPSIKADPDDPVTYTLWIEFLEEYPLRREQWEAFCKVAN